MAKGKKAAQAEISEIDRAIAALQQRKADLLAYMRVEGTIGKVNIGDQLPLISGDPVAASHPPAEKRSRNPSPATLQVSAAAQRAIEAVGSLRTKDLLRHLPPDLCAMLGDTEERQLQRLSQIMSREAKRGRFTINLKTGWGLKQSATVVQLAKQA